MMSVSKFEELFTTFDNMTVLEISQFIREYEERYGVSATPSTIVQEVAKVPEEPIIEEKTTFEVFLRTVGVQKIQVIKAVRELVKIGLADSKNLVDKAPVVLKSDIDKSEAESIATTLKDLGAEVEVR